MNYFVLVFVLKLFDVTQSKLSRQYCFLENQTVGKCIPTSFCPQTANLTSPNLRRACEAGSVCCRVSAKIVTPTNAAPIPAAPAAPVGASPANPQMPAAPAGGTALPTGLPNGSVPPTGATTPPAGTPMPGATPSGTPPSGALPPGTSPPAGAPAPGAAPPAGAPSPGAAPPVGAPAPGAAPPAGVPPAGGAPPAGALPGGIRPAIIGNIVADPTLSSDILSPILDDTVVVSAEVISNAIDMFDKKCDLYYPMVQTPATKQLSSTPIVMIYGGTNTAEKEFPHMAALGYGNPNGKQWLCAGSLITDKYVLTAAHCLSAQPLGEVRYVKLGSIRMDQDTQNTQQFNVVARVQHPQYDSQAQYNDIALLRLDQPVQVTEYVRPICLFSSTNYEDRNLIATGWGKTESGTVSMDLKKVGLELFGQAECQSAYSAVPKQQLPLGIQEASQMCAGSRSPGKDTCQGDSGGPLQIRKNNRWYLVGITSIGIQCGNAKYPGVYSRVAYYLEWIQQNMSNK